ncbi:hypothetical protein NDU88_003773 [Pleurodeles waltl]|uniref:Uncharacterized protein n=1 Tax=Pleurodeles waltl TaxID=8319 RepID=A0AAV7SGV3_PLEWA|nr:hypothetical protein NDU88_003773 [Pleurodeles waltl]
MSDEQILALSEAGDSITKDKDEDDYTKNPFKYMDTDIFLFRSKAIKEAKEERCQQQKLTISEKSTFASRAKSHAFSNRRYSQDDDIKEVDLKKIAEEALKCDAAFALCNVHSEYRVSKI